MAIKYLTSKEVVGRLLYALATSPQLGWIGEIAPTPFPSNSAKELYAALGMVPAMKEWIDGRRLQKLDDKAFEVINKIFEAALQVSIDDLRRDKTGQLMLRIGELAKRGVSHWAKLISNVINNGESTTCYDGKYFFAKNHSHNKSGTQENIIEPDISALPVPTTAHGSVTAPAAEEMAMCILAAIQKILGLKDDQGEPVNEGANKFQVQVPISLMNAAYGAVKPAVFANNGTNIIPASDFQINVVPNPRLTFTNKFVVFRTDSEIKPVLLQEEYGIKTSALAEGSDREILNREHLYTIDTSRQVAPWAWYMACLVDMK